MLKKFKYLTMIKAVADLDVFNISYALAMDIYHLAKNFPKEEKYSLTDQIIRSSRSIAANIAEGWGKRVYEHEFRKYLIYSMGSLEETKVWLLFSRDCGYVSADVYTRISMKCDETGAKIFKLYGNWKTF